MRKFTLEITTLSPLHLGSGRGDVVIDADIIHDDHGLPYFPAKRLKGLLYESGIELLEILTAVPEYDGYDRESWNKVFNRECSTDKRLIISNFHLPEYEEQCREWNILQKSFADIFNPIDVLESYTMLRFQTSIDKKTGVALDTSLRNIRLLDSGIKFVGEILLENCLENDVEFLALAIINIKAAGMKRNRGMGHIKCEIFEDGKEIGKELAKNVLKRGGLYNEAN
ncbi:MAG: RAMP superfamily CRISPR-associated protein [Selenomonadales bacterium]|nr:RAMP superfamily CRISPR-associated protein [Selenomonadales bacterium]